MKIGKTFTKDTLMLLEHRGDLTTDDGEFQLLTMFTGEMVVESVTTRKRFIISWNDAYELAMQAGVNETEDSDNETK